MLEERCRHWLTLATDGQGRLPPYPGPPAAQTAAARLAARKGWIEPGPPRAAAERDAGLSFWVATPAGQAAAQAAPRLFDAAPLTHAAHVAAAMEARE